MSEETKDVQSHEAVTRRRSRHGFFTGVLVGGLSGLVLAGGLATATLAAGGSMLSRMHGHGWRGGHGAAIHDPEQARERAELMAEWILKSVDATEAQQEEVKAILDNSINTLLPIAQNHRDYREELRAELAKPTIDRAAPESIRESGLGLMDQVSREMIDTVAAVAEVLTPEQRQELLEMAERFHR